MIAERERGWALVSVLWVVTALALLAAGTQALTGSIYRQERRALELSQVEAVLDAGVTRAILGIEAPDVNDRWRVDGVPQSFAFDGVDLRIAIQDELGRFDLNAVDASILYALFKSEGVPHDQGETLTDRILDWRSPPSDLHRLHGATDADYAAAGLPYRPRHGEFQSVDELQLVLGMTKPIFDRIRPALTVYTKKPMIDPAHATREALLALFDGDTSKVDDLLAQRDQAPAPVGVADPAISLAGRTFSIVVATELHGRTFSRTAVVEITGDASRPCLILAWS